MAGGKGPAGTTRGRRRAWLVLAATILALGAVVAPARAPVVAAAGDGITLSANATYTIVPSRHVVRVVIDLTARNDKPNVTAGGVTTRYFYEGANLAIQADATNVKATNGGSRVAATVKPQDGFDLLEVRFRSAIFFRQTTKTRITFDLPGGAPRSASDIRVGSAFATFVAWAFGDSGSVRIVIPPGFDAESNGSPVARTTSGATTVLRAASIADPATWYAVVNADNEAALTSERIDLTGGEHVVIRGWPEDDEWRAQVTELLATGLPELRQQTGLDWPVSGDLSIFEVHTPLLEGYAGVFFVGRNRIEISEDLDDLTILHEASHAWFNGSLFEGRWINEGFADTFAARALEGIGIGGWTPKAVDPTESAAVRLMTWEHPGRIADEETDAREQYGYEASWTVIRSLLAEIGDESMRKVLAAAAAHQIPYVGAGTPETVPGSADWRRFLDLLEAVGGSKTATEVFRRWVVTDAQADLLDRRTAARAAYAKLVAAGDAWLTPSAVRSPMATWDFAAATSRMTEALAVLGQRDTIAGRATELGVEPPTALLTAYQTATRSFDEARSIATTSLADLEALGAAVAAVDAPRDAIVALGLVGTMPDVELAAARAAFSGGAADAAIRAMSVVALVDGATEIGRGRLISIAAAVLVVLVLIATLIILLLRRRRRHRALALAPFATVAGPLPTALSGPATEPPYATLADQSGLPVEGPPVDPRPSAPEPAEGISVPSADRSEPRE
ncbi:MAG: hypothetical protein H0U52_00380 [Chloroflexi bacterium]|nr:hypothetical protein [Chloroflexota bacterium]